MNFKFLTADEREKLYNEVWAEPVTTVAKRYRISDTGLRKHCKRLGIPVPPSGYWAKVRAGKKIQKTPLPEVTGELRKYIRNYAIKYRADIENILDDQLSFKEDLSLLREETKVLIKNTCTQVYVKKRIRNLHPLIKEHKEEIIYRKKRDKALKHANFKVNYYASDISKYENNIASLPIFVSESNVNRVYRIIDTLIKTIEALEGYIKLENSANKDVAYFLIMGTYFSFEVKEKAKNKKQTSDRLILTLSPKSWITDNVGNNMEYEDTNTEPLEDQLGK